MKSNEEQLKKNASLLCVELKGMELLRPRDKNTNAVKRNSFLSCRQPSQQDAVMFWSPDGKEILKFRGRLFTKFSSPGQFLCGVTLQKQHLKDSPL